MLRASRFEPCFRVGKGDPIALLIHYKEQIAFVDEFVVVYTDVVDVAGNVGGNTDNISAYTGVPCPGRIKIIASHVVAEEASCNKQNES
jgi:hypothetical protein